MSVAGASQESSNLTLVTPGEALPRSLPLPSDEDMAVDGITDEEWDAFEDALDDGDALSGSG